MSQLIHLKHRIKAVGTIKKITGAMRLISRSFHTRMHREARFMNEYSNALQKTAADLQAHLPETQQDTSFSSGSQTTQKELIIIIGSQKGLCGSYNSSLIYWIDTNKERLMDHATSVIVLGKRVEEHLKKVHVPLKKTLPELKTSTILAITDELFAQFKLYSKVTIISNRPKSFVSYECKETQLVPVQTSEKQVDRSFLKDYSWSHNPEVVLATVMKTQLKTHLYSMLFFSLSGEHAARFIAMDNAMRNANKFLDTMKLQFNKMRQAKITKELTELAGAFETQSGI